MGALPQLYAGGRWVVEQRRDVRGNATQFQRNSATSQLCRIQFNLFQVTTHKGVTMLFSKFRKKYGLYNLRKEVARWVEKNIGREYVDEALEKYDKINSGVPIGGFEETIVFIDMIERIKHNI